MVNAIATLAPTREISPGLITFGTAYDPKTLQIVKPLTRFKRTFPKIAWSAELSRGVTAPSMLLGRRAPIQLGRREDRVRRR